MVSPNSELFKPRVKEYLLPKTKTQTVMIFGSPNAVEYPAPTIFVVGPSSEMGGYENAGQLFVSTDDGHIYMWLP